MREEERKRERERERERSEQNGIRIPFLNTLVSVFGYIPNGVKEGFHDILLNSIVYRKRCKLCAVSLAVE